MDHRKLTGGGDAGFRLNTGLATFTPGMAKRNGGGPFAAGVMVQGKRDVTGIGDDIGLLRGSEIKTGFFPVFDVNQGSLVLWITPEWNGNDNLEHYIFTPSAGVPSLFKYSDNNLYFALLGVSNLISVDVSGWVAGNTYCVVCRWDSKNKFDGTNYACLSINDVNSFGRTTSWTAVSPLASMFITYSIYPSVNAIIEGLTIYRRVLFDGTYGHDIGNSDEIAQIYNAGTGKDPTEITGSWDVVFCLPTNATAGALVTGTGEAWSHPHSSNLLGVDVGFMAADTAWDGWASEGSPINPAKLDTAEKLFNWGYKFESDAANEGYKKVLSDQTAGADFVLRALGFSDDTVGQPKIVIYDETNGAEITSLAGSTSSTDIVPDVLIFSFELPTVARAGVAADCVSFSVKLINAAGSGVVGWHQCELLANLLDNPSLDYGAVADPWIPDAWIGGGIDAGESTKETSIVHSSKSSLLLNANAYDEAFYQVISAASGKFFCTGASVKISGGDPALASPDVVRQSTVDDPWNWTLPTLLWANVKRVGRSIGGTPRMYIRNIGGNGYFDDLYAFALDDVSITATPASLANSQESGGIRVDGYDLLTQPIPAGKLKATSGEIQFKFIPRHSIGIVDKFNSPVEYMFLASGAGSYIGVYLNDNLISFSTSDGVTLSGVSAGITGLLAAGNTYTMKIKYTAISRSLYINGILIINVSEPTNFAANPLTSAAFTHSTGGASPDMVFLN